MSYKVQLIHVRPCLRNGDMETEFATSDAKLFKTKKEAVTWIKNDMKSKHCTKSSSYKMSTYEWFTGFTNKYWFNEGTGEIDGEQFQYKLFKA